VLHAQGRKGNLLLQRLEGRYSPQAALLMLDCDLASHRYTYNRNDAEDGDDSDNDSDEEEEDEDGDKRPYDGLSHSRGLDLVHVQRSHCCFDPLLHRLTKLLFAH
jgi:hypothetical protein